MDEAGYVPIAFVCNFPDVLAIGAYYEDIVEGLKSSSAFEVDMENETLRIHDWQKWLMPNGQGGFGLPRYIKQAAEEGNGGEGAQGWTDGAGGEQFTQEQRARSGSKELSASASEYVFSPPPPK